MKKCTKCNELKPLEEFQKRSKSKDGLQLRCKSCCNNDNLKLYHKHKQYRLKKSRVWRENNKGYISIYTKSKREKDSSFKLIGNLRNRQKQVLKGLTSTTSGLGCNSAFLRSYIEKLWEEGMDWNNYGFGKGKWVLDHKIPLSSFEKTNTGDWSSVSEYNTKLIHYTNLQPMWFENNLKKAAKKQKNNL